MIKICGLHSQEDLELAEQLGADVLGMIYGVPESPRNNDQNLLRQLLSSAQKAKTAILFRNAPFELIEECLNSFKPNIIHLCGDETAEFREKILTQSDHIEIWQSYGIEVDQDLSSTSIDQILSLIEDKTVVQVVLDAKKSGKTGGTGCLLPLTSIKTHLHAYLPHLVIAGGLNSENVAEVIKTLQPKGVDVSSGIEQSPGKKDPKKLQDFINHSKAAI